MAKKTKPKKDKTSEPSKNGRPTLYEDTFPQKLIDYFSKPPYQSKKKTILTKKGDIIEFEEDVATDFPSLAGFAIQLKVHRDTLHEWAQKHPEFSDAYKRAKDYQENFLSINGNKGLIPAPFGIFTLKNVCDWRDKRDIALTGSLDTISDEELDKRLKKIKEGK